MNIRTTLPALTAALLLSAVALPSQAATAGSTHQVTQSQLDQLRTGQAASDVTAALGKPENVTKWLDGSSSLVYELKAPNESSKLVYVDLSKNGTLSEVQVVER